MTADPARITQITQAVRITTDEDGAVKTLSLGARDVEISSSLYETLDADAENLRKFNLIKVARDLYLAVVVKENDTFILGKTITLKNGRFNLSTGKDFRIISLDEDYGREITTLLLWG
tara:strand:+ start:20170 stop:20523 length:354 start_codon:yes stop_codon:yes gene_type:complete